MSGSQKLMKEDKKLSCKSGAQKKNGEDAKNNQSGYSFHLKMGL